MQLIYLMKNMEVHFQISQQQMILALTALSTSRILIKYTTAYFKQSHRKTALVV